MPSGHEFDDDAISGIGVSLREIADEIRERKATPSRSKARSMLGPTLLGGSGGAVVMYMLLRFFTGTFADQQAMILKNQTMIMTTTQATLEAQNQAMRTMSAFAAEQRRYDELYLAIAQQTCRNAVQGSDPQSRRDRDLCDPHLPR